MRGNITIPVYFDFIKVSSYGNGTDEVSWDDLIGYEPGKGCIYMLGHVPVESEDIYFFQDWCLRGKMILE